LIIDISMPTPVNVDVLTYADIAIESLTKFASGHADVMAGIAVFSPASHWASRVQAEVSVSIPYERDIHVLCHHIAGYVKRMHTINEHAGILADYFRQHKGVRKVHDASQEGSRAYYDLIRRCDGGYGGVITVVFHKPLAEIYDHLSLRKGPSFGTIFTLCMPYVYLAHYDLLGSIEGTRKLKQHGLDPDLLRISVGVEPAADIIAAFDEVMG
jgi:cystathionine gamma-synthase